MNYRNQFDKSIAATFKQTVALLFEYPKTAAAMLKVSAHEAKAKKFRQQWHKQGVSVPPLLIVSTTEACNLNCTECYSAKTHHAPDKELTSARINEILKESSAIGCSTVLLAGGEPLLSRDWLYSVAEHPEMLGLVFTNGTLMSEDWYGFFSAHRNLIVLFSVEGLPERTDERRGYGVSGTISAAMQEMRRRKIPFGISITTGAHNIIEVTSDEFVAPYIELGCKLIIHAEYVPMGTCLNYSPLSQAEKSHLFKYCGKKSEDGQAIYISFPGNEEQFGGCLAAGRGFLHIAASGSLEPCPFAPYSDRSLADMPLTQALKSPLLEAVRAEARSLREGIGGCSLRGKEGWLKEIQSKNDYGQ